MKRLSIAAIALVIGALVLAGCGGSSGGGSSESSTTSSTGGSETGAAEGAAPAGGAKFEISEEDRQCLKEKGVELPEFNGGEGGPPMGENGEPPEGFEPPEGGELPEGVEPPEGAEGGPPQGGGFSENSKAFEECGVEMPELKGGPGGEGAPNMNSAAFKKQVNEYVACVRENGYELAEPDFSGEGPIFDKSESESSAFKDASKSCEDLLKGGESGSGSG